MSEPTLHCPPRQVEEAIMDPMNSSIQSAVTSVHDESNTLDHDGEMLAKRHEEFMRAFRNVLRYEGLRSPSYYQDKSQCISFQDCPPGEMGTIKAQRLSWGYVDPEDLVKRLRQLKPSHKFTLRKFQHPYMPWDKTPTPSTPALVTFPEPDWLYWQQCGINDLEGRLGEPLTIAYYDEAQKYWEKVSDIQLTPVPDISLLKHINHSPSGTLFPRFLVEALKELFDSANKRALSCNNSKSNQATVKREETICQWREEHPDAVLADDVLSRYRTWPRELMDRLDGIDQEAIREGRRSYMADLEKTGRKMEELVASWRDCGLITGSRTPQSPQWPDPKAKLRGRDMPQYVWARIHKSQVDIGFGYEYYKRKVFECARWAEAVLNTDSDAMISQMPLTESLLEEADLILKGLETFVDEEDMEDALIDMLGRRRRGEEKKPCSESSGTPEPDSGAEIPRSKLSRSDIRALREAEALQLLPEKVAADGGATWHSRLRPRPLRRHGASRQQNSPGAVVTSKRSQSSINHPPVRRAKRAKVCKNTPAPPMDLASQTASEPPPQMQPCTVDPRRTANTSPSAERVWARNIYNSGESMQSSRKTESECSNSQEPECDKRSEEPQHLVVPPPRREAHGEAL